jgi:anionic cell wall polymer biosynthesis LytR-Cps2A-Psr (LCP) family protein
MERQKIYVKSFISTLLSQTKKDISTPVNLFNESAPYSCTNLNPSKIAYLTKEFVLGGNLETEMITIPGNRTISSKTGYTEFKLDEKAFFEQFLSVYYEKM